jgi:hypothetical protein
MEVDLMYARSVPDGIVNKKDIYSSVNYNLTANTIPFDKDAFRLSNCIAYGTYFTKAKQIILTDGEYSIRESVYDRMLNLIKGGDGNASVVQEER